MGRSLHDAELLPSGDGRVVALEMNSAPHHRRRVRAREPTGQDLLARTPSDWELSGSVRWCLEAFQFSPKPLWWERTAASMVKVFWNDGGIQ